MVDGIDSAVLLECFAGKNCAHMDFEESFGPGLVCGWVAGIAAFMFEGSEHEVAADRCITPALFAKLTFVVGELNETTGVEETSAQPSEVDEKLSEENCSELSLKQSVAV